jgi:hypothetical protein
MMLAVAVAALAFWSLAEIYIRSPDRKYAHRLIAHHEMRAGVCEFMADQSRDDPDQLKEFRRLSGWHRDRIHQLRGDRVPKAEP